MINRRAFCRSLVIATGTITGGPIAAALPSRRPSQKPEPLSDGELSHLAGITAATRRFSDLPRVLAPPRRHAYTVDVKTQPGRLYLKFATPVPAKRLCHAFGWKRPYAIAWDVHQEEWYIRFRGVDLPDPYGPRTSVKTPVLGNWAVDAALTHRPPGPLPHLSAGASPAYDLAARLVGCVMLTIRPFNPDYDI